MKSQTSSGVAPDYQPLTLGKAPDRIGTNIAMIVNLSNFHLALKHHDLPPPTKAFVRLTKDKKRVRYVLCEWNAPKTPTEDRLAEQGILLCSQLYGTWVPVEHPHRIELQWCPRRAYGMKKGREDVSMFTAKACLLNDHAWDEPTEIRLIWLST